MFNAKIHYKWPFSIAMLVYQRVLDRIFSLDVPTFSPNWAATTHKKALPPRRDTCNLNTTGTRWSRWMLTGIRHDLR
jgi:hypothetical protein